jgi:hypothetical protein
MLEQKTATTRERVAGGGGGGRRGQHLVVLFGTTTKKILYSIVWDAMAGYMLFVGIFLKKMKVHVEKMQSILNEATKTFTPQKKK